MNKKQLSGKKWILLFFLILLIGCCIYMRISYRANPLGYFTTDQGLDYYYANDYVRSVKAKYLLAHKDSIDAVLLGGSKAGAVSAEQLSELTGLNYYNMYIISGNFYDYLAYTKFLISKIGVKEITLHISSFETRDYDRNDAGSNMKTPAVVEGGPVDQAIEYLGYLMTDLTTVVNAYRYRAGKDPENADVLHTGAKTRKHPTLRFQSDPDAYVEDTVLLDMNKRLKRLFNMKYASKQEKVRRQNLDAMREIKRLCDENDVTLKMIIGPSFLTEHFNYECPSYYSYLEELVTIAGEAWDFSDFNSVNLNPYNFINYSHYSRGVAEHMLNIVYGLETTTDFGHIVNASNIRTYMTQRQEQFEALRRTFKETGTIPLNSMQDPSYFEWPSDPNWNLEGMEDWLDED